ncbi:DUF4124 domain-containing protein [Shewanella canadensis]|uniref:DUF4124 domain-containing protein n=1 Tax=Shewanella canadensis TaxID=271096 RepID=A0A3S0IP50_9GAMM|nr:DUF4124 domain-containing protein [Shewanella canadensis]RTR38784.1 DUF4124 domain-containing protein [Shewanella canadensis]
METRLSRYILLLILLVAIGLLVHEEKNSGSGLTPSQKAVELFLANRYKAGLFCREKGWDFCEQWADYPRSRFSRVNAALPHESREVNLTDLQPNEIVQGHTSYNDSQALPIDIELHGSPVNSSAVCNKPIPKAVKQDKGKQQIYSWTDENGQVHFTDDARQGDEHDLSLTTYQDAEYSFELAVKSTGSRLPLAFKDKITAAIKKVSEIYEMYLPPSGVAPVSVDLTLATTKSSYQSLQSQYASSLGPSQGFYVAQYNMAAVWHRSDKQAYQTSVHESVHVINAGLFGPTPRWFNEGLAEYFEGIRMSGYAAKIPPREWKRVFSGKSVSLDTLFRAKQETWAGSQQTLLYSQSHSLVHFLMSTPKGKITMKALLANLVETRCAPSDYVSVLNTYPGGLTRLQADWVSWMNSERYRTQSF